MFPIPLLAKIQTRAKITYYFLDDVCQPHGADRLAVEVVVCPVGLAVGRNAADGVERLVHAEMKTIWYRFAKKGTKTKAFFFVI